MKHEHNEYDAHASLVQWVSDVEKHKASLNAISVSRYRKPDNKGLRVVLWIVTVSCFAAIGMMLAY